MADKASRCAIEAADGIKEQGTEVMLIATPNPPETGGVEATRTGKGNLLQNTSTGARKATSTVSVGSSAPIQRKLDPDPDKPTKEIGSNRTTPKDPKKSERGQPS